MMSCSTDPAPDFAGRERRVRLLHAASESLGPSGLARAFVEGNQWVLRCRSVCGCAIGLGLGLGKEEKKHQNFCAEPSLSCPSKPHQQRLDNHGLFRTRAAASGG